MRTQQKSEKKTERNNSVAVVLGASSGIGAAVAEQLAAGGADVTVVWHSGTAPMGCTAQVIDVTDFAGIETLLKNLVRDIETPMAGRMRDMDPAMYDQVVGCRNALRPGGPAP